MPSNKILQLSEIIEQIRTSASSYYKLTGKPLGVTGEIGEYDAAHLLGMVLAEARQKGYDAIKSDGSKVQIKTRALNKNADKISGRVGAIKTNCEWDTVILVIMDRGYNTIAIYEADRKSIEHAKTRLNGKARKEGKIAISEFIKKGRKVWEIGK